ncbi:MAG: TRAP transporter small permease subunit [Geminicoccaceae bacterium]|nr:TRAP transporter small permease subunit [Geminicoccaceae bacterium]
MLRLLKKAAELVALALFLAMFGSFLLQIFMRYVVDRPLGWTLEACMASWIWVVFWSAAFLVDEREHVTFDIFYRAASPAGRRIMATLSGLALLAALLVATPASYDFISFMAIDTTPVMHIRFDLLYAVFMFFLAAVIVRTAARLLALFRSDWRAQISSGMDR